MTSQHVDLLFQIMSQELITTMIVMIFLFHDSLSEFMGNIEIIDNTIYSNNAPGSQCTSIVWDESPNYCSLKASMKSYKVIIVLE